MYPSESLFVESAMAIRGLATAFAATRPAPNNTRILVTAEALDGSGAGAARYIFIYKNVGKMEITDNTGKPIKNMGIVTESADQYNKESVVFYVKVKDPTPYGFSNFRLSSSNPKCGTIRHEAVYIEGTDYVLYKFAAIGYKSGTTTLKVMTKDGSQSVSYTLKVNK